MNISIETTTPADVPSLLELILELARFERLEHEVQATVESLHESLFGSTPVAGALVARCGQELAGGVPSSADREPSRLAAATTAPGRSAFPSTQGCSCAPRAGTARGPISSLMQPWELVGYAIYFFTFSSFVGQLGLWLDDLYVRPAYRRLGLGRALLERVADIGARRGCGRFEWTALRWNANALEFYQKLGARQLDEWVTLRMDAAGIRTLARAKEPGAA